MLCDLSSEESFKDFAKRCPEAGKRIMDSVKEDMKQERIEEAKRLGKKELSLKELYTYQKRKLAELQLEAQAHEVKKKLLPFSSEVRDVLQDAVIGCSISEALVLTDTLIEIYHKTYPGEPQAGIIERKDDWPVRVDEEGRKAVLSKEIKEAFS